MASIGAASAEFSFEVFDELKAQYPNQNIIFAPLSILSALSMLYLGARGNTKAQIDKVVHFDKITGSGETVESQCSTSVNVHTSLKDTFIQITKPSDNYSLSFASRLYAEETFQILPEYIQCVKELYKESVETVSFQKAADQARELINSWAESQTNGMIRNILQPGSVDPQTEMVLVNAIYFKGVWAKAFKVEGTQTMPFRVTEQESKPVQMMYQLGSFKVTDLPPEKMRILELPYASGMLSMWVILPYDISGLEQIENAITFEKLQEWTSSNLMEEKTVKVYLPRMKMEEKYNLTSVLMGLGITDLFSSSADLSGISSVERLKVSEAVHQAFVEIDEAGSEAAGIAGAAVKDESASPEFKVDHPFLFLIRHNPTDGILFLARCVSP
ncbi:ovalbumin-like [Columba livia]|uniref:Ovalbumin n=1 Tax=Columba livia TaxID=8932 RepID=H9CJM6_COLLI|nr:ovalbumin-like [Columba livia]AFC75539.1 ovalbumin [Columba livia]